MTDREHNTQRKRIEKLIRHYRSVLGFGNWKFHHHFLRTLNPHGPGTFDSTVAQTTPSWEYLTAYFDWFLPKVAEQRDRDLRYTVVHELMHLELSRVAPDKVSQSLRKLHELTATNLAWAIVWAEDAAVSATERRLKPKRRKRK